MTLEHDKSVLLCKQGTSRSNRIHEEASLRGFHTRVFLQGKYRFLSLSVAQVQSSIKEDETVVIIDDAKVMDWPEDRVATVASEKLLKAAGRRYRRATFFELLDEVRR